MALQITITDAGRAEIINATNTGTDPVEITAVGLGTGQYTPDPTQTALVSEIKQLTTIAGEVVADDTIHVTIKDEGADAYSVSEFGLFTESGTLFAVYSDPTAAFIQKASGSTLLLSVDVVLGTIDAASLTFGDTSFSNPPASEAVSGVLKLSEAAMALAGIDQLTAMTPKRVHDAFAQFGLGYWKPVADADLAIKSGFYSLPVAMGAANSPLPGSSGSLEVINAGSDDGYVTQKWTQSNDTPDNRIFVRHKRGAAGAWTPWIEMSTTSTGLFTKADTDKPIFEISTDIVTSQSFNVGFDNILIRVNSGVSVVLQALVPATDYKIYCDVDGGLEAISWDTAQPANTILVGGFHAGHTDGIVNPATIWDLKWRPSCSPRGMTLSPDKRLWVDIYLMDVDYGINGYSRGDVTIADGASPPKIPAIYGGNGTTTYGSLTWYEAWDLAIAAGKRLPFYGEFTGFAYGVVEQQSTGADPVTTKYQAGHRSACGVEQVTGALWQWGADINGTTATGTVSWQDITDGRGSVYTHSIRAVLLGAFWPDAANAGSRASNWYNSPVGSFNNVSARSVCEHLKL